MSELLDTRPHEFGGNLIFTEHGLSPYWAIRTRIQEIDGWQGVREFVKSGTRYVVDISYQNSGIAPREEDSIEEVKEYRIYVYEKGNPERKADYLIQPRWANMKSIEGKDIKTLNILGVNVKTQGANIEIDDYHTLLLRAAAEIVDMGESELRRRGSALMELMRAHGIEVDHRDDARMEIRIGRLNGRDVDEVIRNLKEAWAKAGRNARRIKTAKIQYPDPRDGKPAYRIPLERGLTVDSIATAELKLPFSVLLRSVVTYIVH